MKKSMIVSIILALSIIGVAILLAANPWENDKTDTPGTMTKTVVGKMVCLPKIGDGPHTLECALGLHADDGDYYALKNNPQPQTDVNTKVRVSGSFTKPGDNETYDIVGTIDVKKFTVIQ